MVARPAGCVVWGVMGLCRQTHGPYSWAFAGNRWSGALARGRGLYGDIRNSASVSASGRAPRPYRHSCSPRRRHEKATAGERNRNHVFDADHQIYGAPAAGVSPRATQVDVGDLLRYEDDVSFARNLGRTHDRCRAGPERSQRLRLLLSGRVVGTRRSGQTGGGRRRPAVLKTHDGAIRRHHA